MSTIDEKIECLNHKLDVVLKLLNELIQKKRYSSIRKPKGDVPELIVDDKNSECGII